MAAKRKPAPKKRVKGSSSAVSAETRRTLFIEAYLSNGGNVTDAALAAGFSPKAASSQGSRLLKHVKVRGIIDSRRAEVIAKAEEDTGVSLASVLLELKAIVHSDLRRCFNKETGALLPVHLWPDEVARSMASVKVVEMAGGKEGDTPMYVKEVKLWDKNSAIEKAMKHLGAFENDNKQRAGIFDGVPHETLKNIEDKLRGLTRPGVAGTAYAGSASRFTH